MRYLLITDTHGSLDIINSTAQAERADVVLHAGDFGFYDHGSPERLTDRELALRITHSPLPERERKRALLVAPAALRVNPDLPPKTHAKTDTSVKGVKFGLDIETVLDVAKGVVGHPNLKVRGLHMHLGSPILSVEPYRQGIARAETLIPALRAQGHHIDILNMGGGFGINYRRSEAQPAQAFADVIVPAVRKLGCSLVLEPGRFIAGNSGILVSRVIYGKESGGKKFVIQDAAMNDLIRPTLYEAWHDILPVRQPRPDAAKIRCDVVGPICESGDYLAQNRDLPPLSAGDLIMVRSAGAYGAVMASTYNSRPLVPEVLVDGTRFAVVRPRPSIDEMLAVERVPSWI